MGKSSLVSKISLPALLHYAHEDFPVSALIDSGVAVNLIASNPLEKLHLLTIQCTPPLHVTAIKNQPIGEGYPTNQTKQLDLQIVSPLNTGILRQLL